MLPMTFIITTATHLSLGEAVEQHHLILACEADTGAGIIGHIDAAWRRARGAMLERKEP
jgi:hypothetical protein